jgi:hypothetical protein
MTEDEKKYFQFRLSALAYGDADYRKRLQDIMAWCIVKRADILQRKYSSKELLETIKYKDMKYFNRFSDRHIAIVASINSLQLNDEGDIRVIVEQAKGLESFISMQAERHGLSSFVRIRHDLFFDCLKGEFNYRDFAVLCSIYAVIGSKEYPVIITRKRIIAGALGYKSPSLMTIQALSERQDKEQPLTEKQLRLTLDNLEGRNLIMRVQASPRKVYFSNRMTRREMMEKIFAAKIRRISTVKKNRKEDRSFASAMNSTIKVALSKIETKAEPYEGQEGSTKGP